MLFAWMASAIAVAAPAVEWSAPAECPDAAAASRVIADELAPDSSMRVRALVTARDGGFAADVEVSGPAGETTRTLESPECTTLLDAVALIARAAEAEAEEAEAEAAATEPGPEPAVVEPVLVPDATATKSTTDTDTAPTAVAAGKTAPEVAATRTSSPRTLAISPYARASGRIGWGLTPVVDGGGGLALGVQWKRLRVEAFGDVLAPSNRKLDDRDAAVRVFAWSVGLRGCGIAWTDAAERVAIPICGGAETGQLIGKGFGADLASPTTHRDVYVALHAGPAVLARLAPWASVYAGLDAVVLARRPGFALEGRRDPLFRPAPAGVRLTLGLELHFPRRIRPGSGIR